MLLAESFVGFPMPSLDAVPRGSGPTLWLDATQGVTPDGASSRVAAWTSRTGGILAGQATTAAMPLAATLGGLAAVRFDGVDDYLDLVSGGADLFRNVAGWTVFTVAAYAASGTGGTLAYWSTNTLTASRARVYRNAGSEMLALRRLDADAVTTLAGSASGTAARLRTDVVSFSGGTATIRQDRTQVAQTAIPTGVTSNTSSAAARIGSQNGADFAAATVGEIIVYGRALALSEIASVEAYLRAKWGDGVMWYLAVLVPASDLAQAAAVAATVWPDDPEPAANLSVVLTDAQGNAWRGGNAAVTDAEVAALESLDAMPDARWYRYAVDGGGTLAASSESGAVLGETWGWTQSLAAAGLSVA